VSPGPTAIEQVDGDLLSRALVLHDRGAALDGDHVGLDRDVSAGDARLVQQTGLLEEGVHELPQDVVGGLVDLLDDLRVTAVHGEGVVGGRRRACSGERQGDQASRARAREETLGVGVGGAVHQRQRDVVAPREPQVPGGEGRQGALADDDRVHELDDDVRRVGGCRALAPHEQRPTARQRAGKVVAGTGKPVLLAGEEGGEHALALGDERVQPDRGRGRGGHSIALPRSSASSSW
jgi:hypothetical protein